jgi:peroxiredoxin
MDEVKLRYGIPDLELPCAKGGTLSPATFVGHQLIVLFLPTNDSMAAAEIGDYARHAQALSDSDAWLLGIIETADPSSTVLEGCHALATDPQSVAWNAFGGLLKEATSQERADGAVYLFGRGGGLQRVWFGSGHAKDIVQELQHRSDW